MPWLRSQAGEWQSHYEHPHSVLVPGWREFLRGAHLTLELFSLPPPSACAPVPRRWPRQVRLLLGSQDVNRWPSPYTTREMADPSAPPPPPAQHSQLSVWPSSPH